MFFPLNKSIDSFQLTIEELAHIIYDMCSDHTKSSVDIVNFLLKETNVYMPTDGYKDMILKVIKKYKATRTGLEETTKELHSLLYHN